MHLLKNFRLPMHVFDKHLNFKTWLQPCLAIIYYVKLNSPKKLFLKTNFY